MDNKYEINTVVLNSNVKLSGYQGEYVFERIRNSQSFYEQELLDKWVLPNIESYNVVYDIGANIGNHTTYFAHNLKKSSIFSFEPMKENYLLLEKNIKDNNLHNVTLHNFALGMSNMEASMEFEVENNNGTASINKNSENGEKVMVKVLDELDLPLPDFVKIDVEGFEFEVLKGMKRILTQSKPDLWIEVDEKNTSLIINFLSELGYGIEECFLQSDNNILFKKDISSNENNAKLLSDLLNEAKENRENRMFIRKKESQFTYEQKKANELKAELDKKESQFTYEQKKANELKEKLDKKESQLTYEQKKANELKEKLEKKEAQIAIEQNKANNIKKELNDTLVEFKKLDNKIFHMSEELSELTINLENETKRADETLEKLKARTSNFLYEQKKANQLQAKLNMYSKSKLFKLMISKWKLSTKTKFIIKRNIYSVGSWIYIKAIPYPKVRAFFAKANNKLHIFKDTEKVKNYNVKAPSSPKHENNEKTIKKPKQMNVAMIADEFTYNSFKFECNALPIEPSNWQKIFEENDIDIFFCESAWSGTDSVKRPWKGQVYCSKNFKNENRGVLLTILEYCKKNKIPTVFWNKEDPTHYPDKIHNFVDTALKFDHIFTTDRDCVERYKKEYGHKSVHLLMFATQPRLFNPIEKYNRTDEIIFAGSWYNQHPTRCIEMGAILDNIIESQYNLKIYDRQSENSDPNHVFPERFENYLNPCLKHDEIEVAYKSSKYALNINTVTNSDTMFARRVFELMSSNTLVLSNYSKGMQELFGQDVVFIDGEKEIDLKDADKKRINCLYKVLKHHTYKERFCEILSKSGINYNEENESVSIIYRISSIDDAEKVYNHFISINYKNKKAYLFLTNKCNLEDLRKILVKYQSQNIIVYSEAYDSKYGKNLVIDSKYFIFADTLLELDFIDRAVVHFEYIDDDIGVADNGEFKLISKTELNNILFSMKNYHKVKENIVNNNKQEILIYEIK